MRFKFLILLGFVLSIAAYSVPANAYLCNENKNPSPCDPTYFGINKIYIALETHLPAYSKVDKEKILDLTKNHFASIIKSAGIIDEQFEIVIAEGLDKNVILGDTHSLFVNLVISYADRYAFSVPLEEDVVVAKLEQSRFFDALQKEQFLSYRSSYSFFPEVNFESNLVTIESGDYVSLYDLRGTANLTFYT